jgi:radical SAM superfamily enzyme YgiQ (UPF0313 family)
MKKHVLLIAPYIHDFAAYDLWLKPLGLLYIAAATEASGYDVRVVNCLDRLHSASSAAADGRKRETGDGRGKFPAEHIATPECLRFVPRTYKRFGIPRRVFEDQLSSGPVPDVIGVGSMMTYWYGGVRETIDIVRGVYPAVPVILGGVYASLCPDHARTTSGADSVIEGPGEARFLDTVGKLTGGGRKTRAAPLPPAYHLLDSLDSVSMATSFGCPFSCSYCASNLLQPRFVQRPVGDVVDEIVRYAHTMRIRDVAFYDDALLVKPHEHIKPILREIIAMDVHLRFHTPNGLHAGMVDAELANLMKEAGFATVRLSIESVHPGRLEDSCGKVTPQGFRTAVGNLLSAGYAVGELEAYVLMGAPGQRSDEVAETLRFAHESGTVVRLADFSPIPGTAYFARAEQVYGLDLREPLLQNSSVLPYAVPGLHEEYEMLKALARRLNATLTAGDEPGAESPPSSPPRLVV